MTLIIKSYDDGNVSYYCDECKCDGVYDIKMFLEDNCAFDVDIMCDSCNSSRVIYVSKCSDAAMAKDLNAKLEVLRLNREAGVTNHGHKINQQREIDSGKTEVK